MPVPKSLTFDSPVMKKEIPSKVNPAGLGADVGEIAKPKKKTPATQPPEDGQAYAEKNKKQSYEQMIIEAITDNGNNRKGVSFSYIQKYIKGKYMIEGEIKQYVKKAFERLLTKLTVERVSGSAGMNGSIRLTKGYKEKMAKQNKPKKVKEVVKKVPTKKEKKDMNNNQKENAKSTEKPKPSGKVNPKKTAITKTKLGRSKGGKVRLSILTVPEPTSNAKSKSARAKLNGTKVSTAKKGESKKASVKPKARTSPAKVTKEKK